ncbi:MAG TPA: isochorismatase family protein [bacterium]|nr:isochorismatase family protein [bacterium]
MAIWDDVVPQAERDLYTQGGWGGRIGYGRRPALLVVDMYRAFVDPAYPFSTPDAPRAVRDIRTLLDRTRASGCPVFFSTARRRSVPAERGLSKATAVRRPIMAAGDAYEIVPELAPLETESVIVKSAPSAFFGTELASYLIYGRVDTVIVTGTVTSSCVQATVIDAFSHNFRVIIPLECVCDRSAVAKKVTLWGIDMKYGDVAPLSEVLAYLESVKDGAQQPAAAAAR